MSKRNMVIAIDGPSGSGKSTLGKALAQRLRFIYIDSGAVYRAVACKVIDSGVSIKGARASCAWHAILIYGSIIL